MRKIGIVIAALAIASIGLAVPAGAVKAGQYCATADRGTTKKSDNGTWVTCRNSNGWRWVATNPPVTTPPTTTTPPKVHRNPTARQIDSIRRLYLAYFLRHADASGLAYWSDLYANKLTLSQISSNFAKSAEFRNRYGSLSNGAFVDMIYNNVLGRLPDKGGRAHWVGVLDGKKLSRGGVMISFSQSKEFIARTGTLPPN